MSNIINPVLEINTYIFILITSIVILSIIVLLNDTDRLFNIMMDCKRRLVFVICGVMLIFTFGAVIYVILNWLCYNILGYSN